MSGLKLSQAWRKMGAKVIGKHDYKATGLTKSAVFDPSMVSEVARFMIDLGYFLEDLSAMDVKEGILVTYHYDSYYEPGRVAVRALADADGKVTSITSVYQGAEWHEREAFDFLGVRFIGNPNLVPLLLPHDFPDPPPLKKEAGARAAMRDLKLFGEAEILDPAWAAIVNGLGADQREEGAS